MTKQYQQTVSEKLEELIQLKAEFAPALARIARLEKEVRSEIAETGEIPDVDGVSIVLVPAGTREKWDTRALAGFAAAHPELLALRSEVPVSPSVRISYKFK